MSLKSELTELKLRTKDMFMRNPEKDPFMRSPEITDNPWKTLRLTTEVLPQSSATERTRLINHLSAYAETYYKGRHNMEVPVEMKTNIRALERWAVRLGEVDKAAEIVQKYGGPPTKHTIQESLERSARERHNAQQVSQPAAAKVAQAAGQTVQPIQRAKAQGREVPEKAQAVGMSNGMG